MSVQSYLNDVSIDYDPNSNTEGKDVEPVFQKYLLKWYFWNKECEGLDFFEMCFRNRHQLFVPFFKEEKTAPLSNTVKIRFGPALSPLKFQTILAIKSVKEILAGYYKLSMFEEPQD